MKSFLAASLVFLACFALGSLIAMVPSQPRQARVTSTQTKAPVNIPWGAGSEADLSKTTEPQAR